MGIYSVQLKFCLAEGLGGGRGVKKKKIFKKLFSCVILRLYTEFQCPTMPGTGQKVCGGGGGGCVNPIILLSLSQKLNNSVQLRSS